MSISSESPVTPRSKYTGKEIIRKLVEEKVDRNISRYFVSLYTGLEGNYPTLVEGWQNNLQICFCITMIMVISLTRRTMKIKKTN